MDSVGGTMRQLLHSYSREELAALAGVIDYAERMIYGLKQFAPYASLRRSAYGKAVVIETATRGRQCFRLSQTPAVITPNRCGYATPHSPVGRICSYVRPGDEGENALWGEWKVIEIRLFDRFDGVAFEENVRNFLRMRVLAEGLDESVTNLAAFVHQPFDVPSETPSQQAPETIDVGIEPATFGVEQDDTLATLDLTDIDDAELGAEREPTVDGNYFGLSEAFYVNQTKDQSEIIARSPLGPMFVEGVAGSGKTSAALGRTKMLCDFDASNVTSEAAFREVLGPDADYWDGKFAGQFSQESSVGFVRTGELIQYLKETCHRIDLPNLPIVEYKELQTRLRDHRGLSGGAPARRWAGAATRDSTGPETTMEWLRASDAAIAKELATQLLESTPSKAEVLPNFEQRYARLAGRIAEVALNAFAASIAELASSLEHKGDAGFRLDRIAVRLRERLARIRKEILGKDVLWLLFEERAYAGSSEMELAIQIIRNCEELYDKTGARLVWIDQAAIVDPQLRFVDAKGKPIEQAEVTAPKLSGGGMFVRMRNDRVVRAIGVTQDDLYLRLLPNTADSIYWARSDHLIKEKPRRGLGRVRMPLKTPETDDNPDQPEEGKGNGGGQAPAKTKKRSVDSRLGSMLNRRVFAPLRDMGHLYEAALAKYGSMFPTGETVKEVLATLSVGKLTDTDVDLLLCLYQIAGRTFKGAPASLSEPHFFQSVFIDEVQDFTEQQVFLMAEQARPEYRAITAVGDIAQKLHNGIDLDVRACFPRDRLGYVKLRENLRQADAPGLALFSACFRETAIGDGQADPEMVKRLHRAGADVVRPIHGICRTQDDLDRRIVKELDALSPRQTAVVLFPDSPAASTTFSRLRPRLTEHMIPAEYSQHVDLGKRFVRHFATVENAKGLEFDVVLMPMLDDYHLSVGLDRHRFYVAISRARQRLVLLSQQPELDPMLADVVARYRKRLGH